LIEGFRDLQPPVTSTFHTLAIPPEWNAFTVQSLTETFGKLPPIIARVRDEDALAWFDGFSITGHGGLPSKELKIARLSYKRTVIDSK
jgi:hypothetical protein